MPKPDPTKSKPEPKYKRVPAGYAPPNPQDGPDPPPAAPPMPTPPLATLPSQLDPRCSQCAVHKAWLRCKTSDVDLCYDCAYACAVCRLWPLSLPFLDPRDHLCQPCGVPAFVSGDEADEEALP